MGAVCIRVRAAAVKRQHDRERAARRSLRGHVNHVAAAQLVVVERDRVVARRKRGERAMRKFVIIR